MRDLLSREQVRAISERMKSPLRYRVNEPVVSTRALEMVGWVLAEGYLSPGEFTREFEEHWARDCGVKYGVACNSGTAALHLAFETLRLRGDVSHRSKYAFAKGNKVIVPALTCPDTINAVVMAGGKPVIVDVESERLGIDPRAFEDAITEETVGVVPVHLYGVPVLPQVFEIARKHGLWVVEDCAEAHGAFYKGEIGWEWVSGAEPSREKEVHQIRFVGSVGTAGCFSFRGDKVIGIGTGGAVVTNDTELAERARYLIGLASGGGWNRYHSTEMGYSYEMDNLRAALGLAQLDTLREVVSAKQRIKNLYMEFLNRDVVDIPHDVHGAVWWKFAVRLKQVDARAGYERLLGQGIETSPPFTPLYRLPMYRADYLDRHFEERFPVAEDAYKRLLCLPSSPHLQTEDVKWIADAVNELVR